MGAARTTFIIGKDGKVAGVFQKVKPEGHEQEVLKWLKEGAGVRRGGGARGGGRVTFFTKRGRIHWSNNLPTSDTSVSSGSGE